jgi:superfamily I DNA/RNA helicase
VTQSGRFISLAAQAYSDIVKKAALDALQKDFHAPQAKADDFFNLGLRLVLPNLEAELRQPLPPVFSSVTGIQSAQMRAQKSVKDNLTNEADKIGQIIATNPRGIKPAGNGDPSSQSGAQIRAGTALVDDLAVFVKNIGDLNATRRQERSRIVEELGQGSETISTFLSQGSGTKHSCRSGCRRTGSRTCERRARTLFSNSRLIRDALAAGVAPREIGVFTRAPEKLNRARAAVHSAGAETLELSDRRTDDPGERVSIGTMHVAKGLEFKAVAVMACDEDALPLRSRIDAAADEAELEDVYDTERQLLYVAAARARDRLLVTGVKPGSEFLKDMGA